MTTDREPTDHVQTDRRQRRMAEKGDPKYIFTIPRAILPKPSLCDEITATKLLYENRRFAVSLSQSVDLARLGRGFADHDNLLAKLEKASSQVLTADLKQMTMLLFFSKINKVLYILLINKYNCIIDSDFIFF